MAGSLNKVLLIGNLGRDPEIRQSQSGLTVANITIATNESYKDSSGDWKKKTEWHKVVAFGSRADAIGKYMKKGNPIFIEGSLQTRDWEDKEGKKRYTTEVVMRDFQFLGGKDQNDGGSDSAPEPSQFNEPSSDGGSDFDSEDIPF